METYIFVGLIFLFMIVLLVNGKREQKKQDAWWRKKLSELYGQASPYTLDVDALCHVKRFYEKHPMPHQVDDITWNDLDLDQLFEKINYTQSTCGEEYLYYTLRTPVTEADKLDELEQKIQYFETHSENRVEAQLLFKKLGKLGKYSLYDYLDHLDILGEINNRFYLVWDLAVIAAVLVMFYSVPAGLIALVGVLVHNILTYFKKKKEIEPYICSFNYIFSMISVLEGMEKSFTDPLFSKELETIRSCNRELKKFKTGSFLVMQQRNGDIGGNPLMILIDYACMTLFIDLLKFNHMLMVVRSNLETIESCLQIIGSLETDISIALYRASLVNGYCIPDFEGRDICAEKCYHPLLTDPVKNSISHAGNVLLTGSNASGKSTFLKTIGINALFAQTIHTCCADRFQTCFYEVVSSMSLRDSISGGDSYYIAEIKAIKRIFEKIQQAKSDKVKILCFLDEVLRGTNTIERIAGATQILKEVAKTNSGCYAATHDIELTELLSRDYSNYHFEEEIVDGDIRFRYELLKGKATSRNAIRLLQCMGFEESLIREAEHRAERFLETGVWS